MLKFIRISSFVVVLVTGHSMSAQTATILDTVYTPLGYSDGPLTGSIYMPVKSNGAGVVLAHYYTGDRQSLGVWCDTLAAHGYVAMTIDYYDWGSSSHGTYPGPVRALKQP
jgi:hypothetical protein